MGSKEATCAFKVAKAMRESVVPPVEVPGGWRLVAFDVVGSTNDEARRFAEAGDPGPVAVLAKAQTAGRGRRGRSWASPRGGLYVSALLRPALPGARVGLVPLAAGLAVARTLEDVGLKPALRWPNDVDLAGKKVAGVLTEAALGPRPDAPVAWVIVGVGVNVAPHLAPLPDAPAGVANVAEALGRPVAAEELLAPVLRHLKASVAMAAQAPGHLREAWSARAPMLGAAVTLETEEGRVEGTAAGVREDGALLVTTRERSVAVTDPDLVRLLRVRKHP